MFVGYDNEHVVQHNAGEKAYMKITDGKIIIPNLGQTIFPKIGQENVSIAYYGKMPLSRASDKKVLIARVEKVGVATLGLYMKVGNKETLLAERKIIVKNMPEPQASVAGVRDGNIGLSKLLKDPIVKLDFGGLDSPVNYMVESFTITTIVSGEFKSIPVKGNKFNAEIIRTISANPEKTTLIIEDIKYRRYDGSVFTAPSVTLKLTDGLKNKSQRIKFQPSKDSDENRPKTLRR